MMMAIYCSQQQQLPASLHNRFQYTCHTHAIQSHMNEWVGVGGRILYLQGNIIAIQSVAYPSICESININIASFFFFFYFSSSSSFSRSSSTFKNFIINNCIQNLVCKRVSDGGWTCDMRNLLGAREWMNGPNRMFPSFNSRLPLAFRE